MNSRNQRLKPFYRTNGNRAQPDSYTVRSGANTPRRTSFVINSPFYRLSARNPDVRALINLFDRLCRSATQQNQVQVEGKMTLEDLIVGSRDDRTRS
jgi:hypothetical protein